METNTSLLGRGARGRRLAHPTELVEMQGSWGSLPWSLMSPTGPQCFSSTWFLEHSVLKTSEGKSRSKDVTTLLGYGELVFLTKVGYSNNTVKCPPASMERLSPGPPGLHVTPTVRKLDQSTNSPWWHHDDDYWPTLCDTKEVILSCAMMPSKRRREKPRT